MSGIQNSHIELVLGLCLEMLSDLSVTLTSVRETIPGLHPLKDRNIPVSLSRDGATLKRRVACEGIQYLTITMPKLGKWLDKMLNDGQVYEQPEGFAPFAVAGYPIFLQSYWELLWYYQTTPQQPGTDFEARLALATKQVRTFLYCFYKLEVPYSREKECIAISQFVQNDDECGIPWSAHAQAVVEDARNILEECLEGFDPKDIYPKHGPGAVATGEKAEQKWSFSNLYERLHREYPYYIYMYGVRENGNAIHLAAEVQQYRQMRRGLDPTSKVVLVPKDSRGPRTICSEPLEIQYIQQGVASALTAFICRSPYTKGQVNFNDQGINANIALTSSRTREFATLDLKDASDLVSLELFKSVWPEFLQPAFLAARSSHAMLPTGEIRLLKKYAPMGSALCFPVESMIFWAVCVSAVMRSAAVPFNVARTRVYVFGDDICVPTKDAYAVIHALQCVGLTVNTEKCCMKSSFRESCGVDAWNGFDVTPQRIKKLPGLRPSNGLGLVAWAAYAARFYRAGMHETSRYIRDQVRSVLGDVPITDRPEAFISFVIPELAEGHKAYKLKWDHKLQSFRGYLWCVSNKTRPIVIDPWKRLNRDLLDPLKDCSPDEVVVPNATKIKKRWVIAYPKGSENPLASVS